MSDPRSKAFPVLDDSEISALRDWAEEEAFQDGAVLFRAGEVGFPFYVVLLICSPAERAFALAQKESRCGQNHREGEESDRIEQLIESAWEGKTTFLRRSPEEPQKSRFSFPGTLPLASSPPGTAPWPSPASTNTDPACASEALLRFAVLASLRETPRSARLRHPSGLCDLLTG